MDALAWETISGAWAFASAGALMALGIVLLAGHARPWGAFAFSLFSITWGAQAAVANAAHFVNEPALARRLHLISLALLLPLPFFLVEFAGAHAPGDRKGVLPWVAIGVGILPAFLLMVRPEFVYTGGIEANGVIYPAWGPLYAPLVVVPFYLALGVALHQLVIAARRPNTARVAARVAIPAAGLALFVAFAGGNNLAFYATWWATEGPLPLGGTFTLLFSALTLLVLIHGMVFLRGARRQTDPAARRRMAWLAAALLLPLAWGAMEGFLSVVEFRRLQSVGLWRLASVSMIAYGVARWRVFDLPERAHRAGAVVVGLAVSAAGGAFAYAATWGAIGGGSLPVILGLATVAATFPPGLKASRRLLHVPPDPRSLSDPSVLGSRFETYRAAVEAALGKGAEDDPFLSELKKDLDLSDDAAEVIHHFARSSVIVPLGEAAQGYERLRLLGEGGQGRTWLARDRAADRLVALKEPTGALARHDKLRQALLREARAAMRVRHPHIVRVEKVIETASGPILVLEYVQGGSLAALVREHGPLPAERGLQVAHETLLGLEALHRAGIVHGDIKPSNILLDRDGKAKLADFGTATLGMTSGATVPLENGDGFGTPPYIPPESRRGARRDEKSDLWAVAVSLHEVLTNELPDDQDNVSEALPAGIRRVLLRALAPDPAERFDSAAELRRALSEVERS